MCGVSGMGRGGWSVGVSGVWGYAGRKKAGGGRWCVEYIKEQVWGQVRLGVSGMWGY